MSTLTIILATLLALVLLDAAALFFLLRTVWFVSFLRGTAGLIEHRRFRREVERRLRERGYKVVEFEGDNPTQL